MNHEEQNLQLLRDAAKQLESPNYEDLKSQLDPVEQKEPRKRRKIFWMRPVAVAASFALVLGTLTLLTPQIPVLQKLEMVPTQEVLKTTYHDVYLALHAAQDHQREYGRMMEDTGGVQSTPEGGMDDSVSAAKSSFDSFTSHGETNVQVAGVDEADIVKNDGKYLYLLTNVSNENEYYQQLSIVELSTMKLTSQTRLNAYRNSASEIYVKGDRLVTIGSREESIRTKSAKESSDDTNAAIVDSLYGYGTFSTCAVVYDISDRAQIKQVREFVQEGNCISSRLVDDNLYLISTAYQYLDGLKEDNVQTYLPHTMDSAVSAEARSMPAGCISIAKEPENIFTVVSGLNITNDSPASSQTVLGSSSGIVYSTASHLYVTGYKGENTELMRYLLSDGTVTFDRRAEVPGTAKDQFALDEYKGYLRVATTSNVYDSNDAARWEDWTGGLRNNLYILDGAMKISGKVEDLAKGETIQSVRYMGDMAYIVTFRQTDPLFAIDVSNPTNPVVLGQLKIPGFSTYMHPIDENTLVGIGFDADENSGSTTGMKLSLFDVTDPTQPKETHKLIFSGMCTSEAAHNHKTVTYIPEAHLLALPISIYGTVTVDGKRLNSSQDGSAVLIGVDKTAGLTFRGLLSDPKLEQLLQSSKWMDESFDRMINRITYANGRLYTVSNRSVISSDMRTFEFIRQLELYPQDSQPSEFKEVQPYTQID